LSGVALGTYAASAVLPKAIVTATQPVTQVVLPLATHIRAESIKTREALLKAIGLTFILATLGVGALWLTSSEVCGAQYGIKFCDPAMLLVLASAAIAVAVIRTAVVADLLGRRYWRPHLPIIAFILLAFVTWVRPINGAELATYYSMVCWLLLCALVFLKMSDWYRQGGFSFFKRAR
jgi:hypothetical protein